MKKIKSLFLLSLLFAVAVLFTACSHEPLSSTVLYEAFYTTSDADATHFNDLDRVSELKLGKKYTLVFNYYEPDMNVEKILLYNEGELMTTYTGITPQYIYQYTWYKDIAWTIPDGYNNEKYTLKLTAVIVDTDGKKSAPYNFTITLQGTE